jgi:predicted CXXCH cytochrome family protein
MEAVVTPEWVILGTLLAGALPLLFRRRSWRRGMGWMAWLGLAGCTLLGAVLWQQRAAARTRMSEERYRNVPRQSPRADYVSSDHCKACHPDQYGSWHRSYHRTMTQYAAPETVAASIDRMRLEARGEWFHLERRGDEFWVELPDPDWKLEQAARLGIKDWSSMPNAPRVQRRVSMVTGSHRQQKLWVPSKDGNVQFDLPFTYLIADNRWVLREDSIVRDPNLPLLLQLWNLNCIKCHTTAPEPRRDARTGRTESRVVEMGISCEACHGPAEAHLARHRQPLDRYVSHWRGEADPTIVNPAKLDKTAASHACAQCHAIKIPFDPHWEQHGFAFRPGDDLEKHSVLVLPAKAASLPNGLAEALQDSEVVNHFFWPDGQVRISGREFNAMAGSPCYERGQMSCLSCHSLHQSHPDQQLAAGMRTNEACYQCHESYRATLAAHSHHRPDSSGSECYNCHMPHTNWGLLKAIRSHQVTNPNVQTTLQTGRPNACNLCHLDRSLGWTARHLSEWYGTAAVTLNEEQERVSAAVQWLLRGDAGHRALMAWHLGWAPAREASGQGWVVPYLAHLLVDPYGAVRYRAFHSLKRLPGFENFEYDYVGPPAQRLAAREQALEIWRKTSPARRGSSRPEMLLRSDGTIDQGKFDELARQRDDRSVFLIE